MREKRAGQSPATTADAPRDEQDAHARLARREARTEAVLVLGVYVALLAGLAVVDKPFGLIA